MYLQRQLLFLISLIFLCLDQIKCEEKSFEPIISLKSGQIRGYVDSSSNGIGYYGFRGIPYAKPPIKSLRFKAPEPVDGWDGILNCTEEGNICPQVSLLNDEYAGDEDCLNINVYIPQKTFKKLKDEMNDLLPVMVVIHGGGYIIGSGGEMFHGPQMMMNHPVVLVACNYRLGIFGFFSTEDKHAHGNYGMLDQVLALKWVQENIQSFGGDPNRVTLYGISAGASSVVHQMLSPLAKGLFHKAIIGSGTVVHHWAVKYDPLQWAQNFAKQLNCPNSVNSEHIVQCLSGFSAKKLSLEARKTRLSGFFPCDLIPTIDPIDGPGFQTENPTKLLKEGKIVNKVPVVFGMTSFEGYSIYLNLARSAIKSSGRDYFKNHFPAHLETFSPIRPNMTIAHRAIAEKYYANVDNLDDQEIFEATMSKLVGDAMFTVGVVQTAELFRQFGVQTYFYVFNYFNDQCFAKLFGGVCGKYVSHADDMLLSFRAKYLKLESARDITMSGILNNLWSTFIHDGEMYINENEKWPLYNANRQYVELSINSTVKSGLLSDKINFWTEVLPSLMHKVEAKDEL